MTDRDEDVDDITVWRKASVVIDEQAPAPVTAQRVASNVNLTYRAAIWRRRSSKQGRAHRPVDQAEGTASNELEPSDESTATDDHRRNMKQSKQKGNRRKQWKPVVFAHFRSLERCYGNSSTHLHSGSSSSRALISASRSASRTRLLSLLVGIDRASSTGYGRAESKRRSTRR